MFKNKRFTKFCLKFMSWFRKFYSPLIFWMLWFFWIRWIIKIEDIYAAKVIWNDMLHCGTLTEFREKLKRYDWLPELKEGLVDFTYQLPWLCFCGDIPTRFGRDCDDFANLSWLWCEIHNVQHLWQIMSMRNTVKSAHIFTVALIPNNVYVIQSNGSPAKYIAASSIDEAIDNYVSEDTVWVVYKEEVPKV